MFFVFIVFYSILGQETNSSERTFREIPLLRIANAP